MPAGKPAGAPGPTPQTTPAASPAPAETDQPAPEETLQPDITPAPERPLQAVAVSALSGSGDKQGPVFALAGSAARIKYELQGDETASLSVIVIPEGQPPESQQPSISVTGPASDQADLSFDPGRYYLQVVSSSGSWTITVIDLR